MEKVTRKEIDFKQHIKDTLFCMCEGNPGALRVLTQLVHTNPTLLVTLDDMNIRGVQVWLGYKDHCREKLEVFIKAIRERDRSMINTINREIARMPAGTFRPKAVFSVGRNEREELNE